MKINKEQYEEWLENHVTVKVRSFLKEWARNIEEGAALNYLSSPINSKQDEESFLINANKLREQYKIIQSLLNLSIEEIEKKG